MLAALNLMQFQGYLWLSSAKIGAGHYGLYNRLSVLYFPFSETTPIMAKAGYGLGGIWNCPPQANRRNELLIAHGSDKVAGCFQFWRY